MNIIKILQPDQAQKIAAGEVIERPGNIVKELIENSIDAKSTQISLYIENSGKSLIRTVDNGQGMSCDDAILCFLPHATSKITNLNELENINSFGFRGEALASISAISVVSLITKLKQLSNDAGVKIEFYDGKVQSTQKISCNVGTDIQIKDLFYNVPVRKKFLKQDETEWNHIQSIFHAFCLSHISIHFKLFRDNKMILNIPAVNDFKDRITQIWDGNLSQNLLKLYDGDKESWIKFSGYISNHNFWRYGKTHIFLFVNNRWVKNIELSRALLKGYLNVLPPDKSPAAFIFTTINKTLIDINCHPKKEEVRFLKPLTVQTKLQELIKLTLEANLSKQISAQEIHPLNIPLNPSNNLLLNTHWNNPFNSAKHSINFPEVSVTMQNQIPTRNHIEQCNQTQINQTQETINQSQDSDYHNFKIIGQLFNTYILLENGDDFVIIDQHAAHERILYEKMLKNFEAQDGVKLIFPTILKLTNNQISLLSKNKDFLQKQGIDFDVFGQSEIVIKSGPAGLAQTSMPDFIIQVLNFIEENEYLDTEIFRKKLNEHMHSHLACKLAIKAGDQLSHEQMNNLLKELQKTEKRFICVHGRPTTWSIKKYDVEKNFRRK